MSTATECKHCDNQSTLARRHLINSGWRFYDGTTQTGKELHDVVCNECTGQSEPQYRASDDEADSFEQAVNHALVKYLVASGQIEVSS